MPDLNPAIPTGHKTIVVIDADGSNGEASIDKLQSKYGKLPPTVEAITGREDGGRHLWFRSKVPFPCTTGWLGKGIDTRGDGGYVIAPCSVHPSGKQYAWSVDSAHKIAELPDWVYGLSTSGKPSAKQTPSGTRS